MMRRVEDVFDCWFDSGSMPFAQLHYPFENQRRFEDNFPADFICEYVSQTRGWFYTLHVLSTALFDRPAFENCIAHGILLGSDGRKLSKRLRNFPDPEVFFSTFGADAMRWYLLRVAGAARTRRRPRRTGDGRASPHGDEPDLELIPLLDPLWAYRPDDRTSSVSTSAASSTDTCSRRRAAFWRA